MQAKLISSTGTLCRRMAIYADPKGGIGRPEIPCVHHSTRTYITRTRSSHTRSTCTHTARATLHTLGVLAVQYTERQVTCRGLSTGMKVFKRLPPCGACEGNGLLHAVTSCRLSGLLLEMQMHRAVLRAARMNPDLPGLATEVINVCLARPDGPLPGQHAAFSLPPTAPTQRGGSCLPAPGTASSKADKGPADLACERRRRRRRPLCRRCSTLPRAPAPVRMRSIGPGGVLLNG